jgi:hypothetical protein
VIIKTIAFSSALALNPISPARAQVIRVRVEPAPVRGWPARREPVDRHKDHPAEEEGTLVFGVGASGIHTNVEAQHIWYQNDYTSVASTQFLGDLFRNTSPRSKLTLRVHPQGQQSFRAAITRRTVGSRTGR